MFPSMRRSFVCLRFPPRLDNRYTGKLFVVVRLTRYGFARPDIADGAAGVVAGAAAVVETLATPRKWLRVEGRGRAMGRRNGSIIGEEEILFSYVLAA
jgi:hypothetical protein